MQGLRTPDVKKVEYLEFPSDPRFRGARRVVNIIVHEYAYGGYTKLTRTETLNGSHFKQNQYPVTLRATYASEKIQIRNTIGFTHSGIPADDQQGSLTYQTGAGKDYNIWQKQPEP